MKKFDVDLFVIGAGSGGVRAARIAASHGAKVALAEEYRVGGTCVIRGCVPKKLMVYASRYKQEFNSAAAYGWRNASARFDWPTLQENIAAEVARLESIYKRNLNQAGVELLNSRAVVEGPHTVKLAGSGKSISAERILVSTGAKPHFPSNIPGGDYAITSNDVFNLREMPKRIIVIGGGYIAVEFAGIFGNLGAVTRIIHRGEKVLRGFDEDLRDGIQRAYTSLGISLSLGQTIEKIVRQPDGLLVTLSGGEVLETDAVLVATGRTPNTSGLGLEAAGVALDADGGVKVDAVFRTTVPSIFAVGDVTNQIQLTPVAIREGHAFADQQFGKKEVQSRTPLVPSAVFSSPEIASVGLSEEAARARFAHLQVFRSSFRPMKQAFSAGDAEFIAKLLVDGDTDQVVGAHLLGEGAAEMIQLIGVAMSAGVTKLDFDRTLAVHPTIAEELVTMRTPVAASAPTGA
jgi:glutathione reductase (NADPH)